MPFGTIKVDSIITTARTVTLDDVVTTDDTGTVTGAMIADGAITNADINASAAIAGSKLQAATTSSAGAVQLTDSTSSTSTTTAATPQAVKSAYDLADAALPKSGGTLTGAVTFAAGQVLATAGAGISVTDNAVSIASNSNGYGVRTVQTGGSAYGGSDGDICLKV